MPPLEQFLVAAAGTTVLAAVAHRWLGDYPRALSSTRQDRVELLETAVVFSLVFATVTYSALVAQGHVAFDPVLARVAGLRLDFVFATSVLTHVVVPLAIEFRRDDRSLSDLGLRRHANPLAAVALVGVGIGVGVSAVSSGQGQPQRLLALLAALYVPVFQEEFLYRGVVQSKLERTAGQTRAWIASGVLFGVGHAPIDFLGSYWIASGGDLPLAVARLASQIGFGLLFGVLYAKARTLAAPVLAHYLSNELADLVATVTAQ